MGYTLPKEPGELSDIVVTTYNSIDLAMKVTLDCYFEAHIVNNVILSRYIERSPVIGVRSCYKTMLALRALNKPTKRQVRVSIGINDLVLNKAVEHLLQIGYILPVERPRLIKPFGKYKVEKAYIISPKGEQALVNIVNAIRK